MFKFILLLFISAFASKPYGDNHEKCHKEEITLLERSLDLCEDSGVSLSCLFAKADYRIGRIERLCDLTYKFEENSYECIDATEKFFQLADDFKSHGYIDSAIIILKSYCFWRGESIPSLSSEKVFHSFW